MVQRQRAGVCLSSPFHCGPTVPTNPPSVVLQLDALSFQYPQRPVFSTLSARITPGVTLVRAGDGCGKTTLLRVLAGALPAQAGTLQIHGVCVREQPEAYRCQVFWADPQSNALDQMRPRDYFAAMATRYPGWNAALLDALVEGLSLAPHLEKPLYMLSTGSKRKVWLAAAFASGAAVTLLDTPFAALDKASIALVMDLLHEAAEHPTRAWVVAHYEALGDVPLALTIDLGD